MIYSPTQLNIFLRVPLPFVAQFLSLLSSLYFLVLFIFFIFYTVIFLHYLFIKFLGIKTARDSISYLLTLRQLGDRERKNIAEVGAKERRIGVVLAWKTRSSLTCSELSQISVASFDDSQVCSRDSNPSSSVIADDDDEIFCLFCFFLLCS